MGNEIITAEASTPTQRSTNNIEESGTLRQFLTFILDNEVYGVEILKVQEIRGWSNVTPIPNAPEFIRGIMNLRGAIVPILDLRRRFGMTELEFTKQTVVVVVNVQDRTVGMVVDGVSDVIDVLPGDVRPSPDFGSSIDADLIDGLTPVEDKMVIMLNIDAMLQSCDLVELDKLSSDTETE